MDNSILLARFIGPFIVVVGAAILLNAQMFRKIGTDFFKNSALVYLGGIMTFFMGLAVVLFHNLWTADWRVIITVFGWLTLVKGAVLIICPDELAKSTKAWLKNTNVLIIPWSIMLALGIFLIFKGF